MSSPVTNADIVVQIRASRIIDLLLARVTRIDDNDDLNGRGVSCQRSSDGRVYPISAALHSAELGAGAPDGFDLILKYEILTFDKSGDVSDQQGAPIPQNELSTLMQEGDVVTVRAPITLDIMDGRLMATVHEPEILPLQYGVSHAQYVEPLFPYPPVELLDLRPLQSLIGAGFGEPEVFGLSPDDAYTSLFHPAAAIGLRVIGQPYQGPMAMNSNAAHLLSDADIGVLLSTGVLCRVVELWLASRGLPSLGEPTCTPSDASSVIVEFRKEGFITTLAASVAVSIEIVHDAQGSAILQGAYEVLEVDITSFDSFVDEEDLEGSADELFSVKAGSDASVEVGVPYVFKAVEVTDAGVVLRGDLLMDKWRLAPWGRFGSAPLVFHRLCPGVLQAGAVVKHVLEYANNSSATFHACTHFVSGSGRDRFSVSPPGGFALRRGDPTHYVTIRYVGDESSDTNAEWVLVNNHRTTRIPLQFRRLAEEVVADPDQVEFDHESKVVAKCGGAEVYNSTDSGGITLRSTDGRPFLICAYEFIGDVAAALSTRLTHFSPGMPWGPQPERIFRVTSSSTQPGTYTATLRLTLSSGIVDLPITVNVTTAGASPAGTILTGDGPAGVCIDPDELFLHPIDLSMFEPMLPPIPPPIRNDGSPPMLRREWNLRFRGGALPSEVVLRSAPSIEGVFRLSPDRELGFRIVQVTDWACARDIPAPVLEARCAPPGRVVLTPTYALPIARWDLDGRVEGVWALGERWYARVDDRVVSSALSGEDEGCGVIASGVTAVVRMRDALLVVRGSDVAAIDRGGASVRHVPLWFDPLAQRPHEITAIAPGPRWIALAGDGRVSVAPVEKLAGRLRVHQGGDVCEHVLDVAWMDGHLVVLTSTALGFWKVNEHGVAREERRIEIDGAFGYTHVGVYANNVVLAGSLGAVVVEVSPGGGAGGSLSPSEGLALLLGCRSMGSSRRVSVEGERVITSWGPIETYVDYQRIRASGFGHATRAELRESRMHSFRPLAL